MKKIIIWGINVIVIILTVFLVSCIIRNNANRSNDIKTQKNTVTVKETVQDGNYSIGFYSYEKKIRNKTKKCWIPFVLPPCGRPAQPVPPLPPVYAVRVRLGFGPHEPKVRFRTVL